MPRLRLITFDLDNTLWSVDEVIPRAERAWADWLRGRHPEHGARLYPSALAAQRDRLLREESHLLNDLTRLRVRTTEEALVALGLAPDEANESALAAFDAFHAERNRVTLFDGVEATLRELSQRYVLGVLTNGNADLTRIGIRQYFRFHHSSETIGRRKPAPDMFRAALASVGVRPEESLHVGDHPLEDVDAARRVGFSTVWFDAFEQRWPSDVEPPRCRIERLEQLLDVVGEFDEMKR